MKKVKTILKWLFLADYLRLCHGRHKPVQRVHICEMARI